MHLHFSQHFQFRFHERNLNVEDMKSVIQSPDFKNETVIMSLHKKGRSIHFNHAGECTTPDWCPFLKPKKEKVEPIVFDQIRLFHLNAFSAAEVQS